MGPFVPPIVLAISKNPIVENYDLSSVRMVLSGAAPLGKELEDAFRARLPNAVLGQVTLHSDSLLPTFSLDLVIHAGLNPWDCNQNIVTQKHIFWVGGNRNVDQDSSCHTSGTNPKCRKLKDWGSIGDSVITFRILHILCVVSSR